MDFVEGVQRTTIRNNTIWVISDRMTKSPQFMPIKNTNSLERLARVYVLVIVKPHGVPRTIFLDRDPSFTLRFWQSL